MNDNTKSLKIDHHYVGTVTDAKWTEARTGNLGLELTLACEDGTIQYILWITEKNQDKAERELDALGVSTEERQDYQFVATQLLVAVRSREVTFRIQNDEYKGVSRLQVAGIGRVLHDEAAARRFSKFFSKNTAVSTVSDSDIPF